ncbi:MAG: hypothetical protein AAB425_12030, partial [Bdellovibrionota bacterium]
MLNPLSRMVTVEEAAVNPAKWSERILGKRTSTVQTETEFMRNYLLYLEKTKVDITAQPYRGRALTAEQARFQQLSALLQSARFGPAAKLAAGMIGTGAAVAIAGLEGKGLWTRFLDYTAESSIEPVPIEQEEIDRVKRAGATERASGWMSDPSAGPKVGGDTPGLPAAPELPTDGNPLGGVWEAMGTTFGRAWDGVAFGGGKVADGFTWVAGGVEAGLGWSWGLVKSAAETAPAQETYRLWQLVDQHFYKIGAVLALDRTIGIRIREHSRELSNQFLHRYGMHLAEQSRLARALITHQLRSQGPIAKAHYANQGEQLAALEKIVASQVATAEFLEDGTDPKEFKVMSRMIYRYLYGPQVGRNRPMTEAGLYHANRIEALEARTDNAIPDPDKKVRKNRLFVSPESPLVWKIIHSDYGNAFTRMINDRIPGATSYQQWLYRNFGGLARAISTRMTEQVIEAIATFSESAQLEKPERERLEKMLDSLAGVEILNDQTQRRYLDAAKRVRPYGQDPRAKSLAQLDKIRSEIGDRNYLMNLRILARGQEFTPPEAVSTFNRLFDLGLHVEALAHLNRNFRPIAQFVETEGGSAREKLNFFSRVRTAFDYLGTSKAPASPASRALASTVLLGKILTYPEPRVRYAFFTQLAETPVFRLVAGNLGVKAYQPMLESQLPSASNLGELLNLMYYLREVGVADPAFVSELFNRRFFGAGTKIESLEQIDRILRYDYVWKGFNPDSIPKGLQAWEKAIVDRYLEAARKYEPFRFDPVNSEKIQTRLLEAFRTIAPDASPRDKIEFWEKLARRGTNGL